MSLILIITLTALVGCVDKKEDYYDSFEEEEQRSPGKTFEEFLLYSNDGRYEEAEILFGESKWQEGKHCLHQALDILHYLNEAEKGLYSLERMDKISGMEDRLDELNP